MDITDASPAGSRSLGRIYRLVILSHRLKEIQPVGICEISIPSVTGAISTSAGTVLSTDLIFAIDTALKDWMKYAGLLDKPESCEPPTTSQS